MGPWGAMLMAFFFTSVLLLAGQTWTHRPQLVQSSGATWRMYLRCSRSFQRADVDLNAAGAAANSSVSQTFARMTACGHTITHLPHWMQISSSQTGMSCARLRFSHFAVP